MKTLYYIAIVLPSPLQEQVQAIKREIAEKYGCRHALRSPSHITLYMPFRADDNERTRICRWLEGYSQKVQPISLDFGGWDHFDYRVFFLSVSARAELLHWYHAIQSGINAIVYPGASIPVRPLHPHITLAHRDLNENVCQRLLEDFSLQPFHGTFTAEQWTLLRQGNFGWEAYEQFQLPTAT